MNYLKANFLAIIAITLSTASLLQIVVSKSQDAPKNDDGDISKVLEERGANHGAIVAYVNEIGRAHV